MDYGWKKTTLTYRADHMTWHGRAGHIWKKKRRQEVVSNQINKYVYRIETMYRIESPPLKIMATLI